MLTLGVARSRAWLCRAGVATLVSHSVLPGRRRSTSSTAPVGVPPATHFSTPGPSVEGRSIRRPPPDVGYTIAYPPAHRRGDQLPLVVMLHGYGGNHTSGVAGMSPAHAVALSRAVARVSIARPPMALVTVDGGSGYWNPHPGDDPMGMVVDELIPRSPRLGLGRPPHHVAVLGISMGGYGALLLAERFPALFGAVAAVSPAVWTSYPQAGSANPAAYASAAAFAADDVITHAAALGRRPVRIASGHDDPFYPGVQVLARALPAAAVVALGPGCHDASFFVAQEPPSLAFLASHLA